MDFKGKKGLVFGVANHRSIAVRASWLAPRSPVDVMTPAANPRAIAVGRTAAAGSASGPDSAGVTEYTGVTKKEDTRRRRRVRKNIMFAVVLSVVFLCLSKKKSIFF